MGFWDDMNRIYSDKTKEQDPPKRKRGRPRKVKQEDSNGREKQ